MGGQSNAVRGLSPNTSERQQRLNESLSVLGTQAALDQTALYNFLVGGGGFEQGVAHNSGNQIFGNFESAPSGPGFNIVTQGLQGEETLSNVRQNIALRLLDQAQGNIAPANAFQHDTLGQAGASLQAQGGLLGSELGTFLDNQALNQRATDALSNFFETGGAPTDSQQALIGDIFNAQRAVGQSNLQQQFGGALQQLQDQATTRGLRFNDTPIQDRGGALAQEFIRNMANLEASLGGQQAAALLDRPLQEAGLAGSTQAQQQNQMLDIINAFSTPISRGFDVNNQFNAQNQFGLQFTPAAQSGASLQNLAGLLGAGNFASAVPTFSPTPIAQNPSFGRTFTQSFASSFGQGLGEGAASGVSQGLSGGVANSGGQPGFATQVASSGGGGGGGGGASFAGMASAFSNPRFKESIEPMSDDWALSATQHIPIYRWRYIGGGDEEYIGGMTTDMPDEIIAGDLDRRDAYNEISYIGMLTGAIRALAKEVQTLKEERHATQA